MARPRVIEVNYHDFMSALRKARVSGERVEAKERKRWKQWVREHRIKEAAFKSIGSAQFDNLEPVIIDSADEWKGYYLHSSVEEVCLKWERVEEA